MITLATYAKEHLIEQIMAIEGRASSCPTKFRHYLEGLPADSLAARLRTLTDGISAPDEGPQRRIEPKLVREFPARLSFLK